MSTKNGWLRMESAPLDKKILVVDLSRHYFVAIGDRDGWWTIDSGEECCPVAWFCEVPEFTP